MIRLNRGECPKELTQEIQKELTKLYKLDKQQDVWNQPKIKQSLKEALMSMSHNKCAYCECLLNVESKDVTIDHFLPKSVHTDQVMEWENLLPTCLRCNRAKGDHEETVVNPCKDTPKEYLAFHEKQPFRLKGIDVEGIGHDTIEVIDLNDFQRVMTPRMLEWEMIYQKLQEICQDLSEEGYKEKYGNRFYVLMKACAKESPYAAAKATYLLNDELYVRSKEILRKNNAWTNSMKELEDELEELKLELA